MTSSTLAGERRWGSGRRSGMTVLGKVNVPKPINLPSQRLENHGLDPSVEIVPKGTHSWGSRSSSSSNAWGSSTLSPRADGGGTGSPSHPNGRPSSGETGTRPSTAGSDSVHEPITSACGSNSRPSSASGALASNQTLHTPLRPCSADTRPGSSQLSRFAESLTDNSVSWGASGTAEKLGVASSKNESFSLASGDFPTLGCEKETSVMDMDSQEHSSHSCPGSSSNRIAGKESTGNSVGDVSINANVKSGPAHSWRRENVPYSEDGATPGIEDWHPDSHAYPNSGMARQHYDSWHGPPVNNHPGGGWYRGPPGVQLFVSPVPPAGFPMEPFPYYRPQMPPAALANQQPVPPPGVGPRGPHPKNGDMYRPHMHEAYIRPGMPARPGFYPGQVSYEGYYDPPMGYYNSNERDMPFMGMPVNPAPFNRYLGQNPPEAINSHARSGGYGPNGKRMVLDKGESCHPPNSRGPYKVLLKQHDAREGKEEEELKWGDRMESDASYPGKGGYPKSSSESDWRDENKKDEQMDSRRIGFGEEDSSQAVDNLRVIPVKVNSAENVKNQKASDDSWFKKLGHAEDAASAHPQSSAALKDPSLIQKIESLNAKARASGGRQDVKSASTKGEHKNKLHACNPKFNQSAIAAGNASSERAHSPGVIDNHKSHTSALDKGLESTVSCGTSAPRRLTHAMNDRAGLSKGRFSTQDADGWFKKPHVAHLPSGEPCLQFGSASVVSLSGIQENPGSYPLGKDDRESMPPKVDSHVQHAKMSDLAKQRLKQREKEEEERARDQKARAVAKLGELNRRVQAGESSSQKPETTPSSASHSKEAQLLPLVQPVGVSDKGRITTSALGSKTNAIDDPETTVIRNEKPPSSSIGVLQAAPNTAHKEPVVYDQSEYLQQEVGKIDSPHPDNVPPTHEAGIPKQKRVGSKQKQNSLSEKNASKKLISSHPADTVEIDATLDVPASKIVSPKIISNEISSRSGSNLLLSKTVITESSLMHRKKNRGGRNKHKVEEPSAPALSPMGSKDPTILNTVAESSKPKTPESDFDPVSEKFVIDSKDSNQSQCTYLPSEEAHGKNNNQWRSQHSHRMPRNPQGNKSTEKFHAGDAVKWAPVRSQNKTDVIDEANLRTWVEVAIPATRSDQQVQNNARHKRAEIELYVPKPVAKEMAQQGSSHQAVTPSLQMSDDSVGIPDSGSLVTERAQTSDTDMAKVGSAVEPRNGDVRQSKSGKVHRSWRQWGSLESTFTSNPGRNVQKVIEPRHPEKPEVSTVKDQSSAVDDWGISDGWNIPEKPVDPASVSVVKDHGVSGRGKPLPYKGQKYGYAYDPAEKRSNALESDPSSSLEMSQAELHVSSKENRAVGERSISHWQPKPHQLPASNKRGSRTSGGHNAGAETRPYKKDSTDEDIAWSRYQSVQDQLLPVTGNFEGVPSEEHHEGKDRKAISHKGGSDSPAEPSSNISNRREQRPYSGFRRNGNQNRFGREREYHGGRSGSEKDNKQQNVPASRERQGNSSHYEYQQVGAVPRNNNKASSFESSKESSHNSGVKYKDRGQEHSRHGGGDLYSRQSNDV